MCCGIGAVHATDLSLLLLLLLFVLVPSPGAITCYRMYARGATDGAGAAAASPGNGSDASNDGDGGIDLNSAMANARANLAAGIHIEQFNQVSASQLVVMRWKSAQKS